MQEKDLFRISSVEKVKVKVITWKGTWLGIFVTTPNQLQPLDNPTKFEALWGSFFIFEFDKWARRA